MFNKREKIDEIELGAELYLEGLEKSIKVLNTKTETPQEKRAKTS